MSSCLGGNTTNSSLLLTGVSWLYIPGDDSQEVFGPYSSYISLGIVLVAALLSGIGAVVQSKAHEDSSGRKYCPRPLTKKSCSLMTLGIIITIIAAGLDLAALMFGNITLVVPLGSLKLVVSVLFGAACKKRKVTLLDGLFVVLILVGCGLSFYFSVPRTCIFTLADLQDLYTRIGVIAYASCVGALIVGVLLFLGCVRQIEKRHGTDSLRYSSLRRSHQYSYPLAAGMLGAQGVLFGKALVEIITDYTLGLSECVANHFVAS